MCTRNNADGEREERCAHGAREGKIKGRGTFARASHGLHMVFCGTALLRCVPGATLSVCATSHFCVLSTPSPEGA
jgi:hypothetical protein